MNYEGQICRGPMERSSYMLPVAVGCSYNRCKFCTLFKHLSYRVLPIEQVEAELARVRNLGGNPKTVFLGDGNAFGLSARQLLEIIDLIHKYFSNCETINMDAAVTNILVPPGVNTPLYSTRYPHRKRACESSRSHRYAVDSQTRFGRGYQAL